MKVASWGGLTPLPHTVRALSRAELHRADKPLGRGIAFGMGRSYGDVCLNPGGVLWQTTGLDGFIAFDEQTGRLCCEAGVLLKDIQRLLMPRGWALAVTPGTQFVTVGGAIANDVHGKNHHVAGSFGDHVSAIRLLRTDGEVIDCGPEQATDWFRATVGGLGLTGLITLVELQLQPVRSVWLNVETCVYHNLNEFFALSAQAEKEFAYSVSWVDCLAGQQGRGVFIKANHSPPIAADSCPPLPSSGGALRNVPFTPPFSLINKLSLRCFNQLYFHANQRKKSQQIQHYTSFFYPLDNVQHWNRLYGRRGFYQYQCVIPPADGALALKQMLDVIARADEGSFLSVLKTFGSRTAPGMLSFPMPGVTLALDFPNRQQRTQRLFAQLDGIVSECGGRLYPAKDARMPRRLFAAGYPELSAFLAYRDPGIQSALARRLID